MTQHALGSEYDQRLAPVAQSLAAQQVKILHGVRRLRNLDIVFRRKLNEALDAGARVLRSLALVAVREKQNKARKQIPFRFASRDELIDDRLRYIHKIAELRLPEDKRLRIVAAVAVFET